MAKTPSAPSTAMHARPEAVSYVLPFTEQVDPFANSERPVLQEVHIEASGRCVSTNGHVLAIYDPATPPTDLPYPTYEKVIPTTPPVVKVLMSVEYLKQALEQIEKFGNDTVVIELWSETRPVKFSIKDENGQLCLYIMPKAMPPALEPPTDASDDDSLDDGIPF
jgi:hypothetical protein